LTKKRWDRVWSYAAKRRDSRARLSGEFAQREGNVKRKKEMLASNAGRTDPSEKKEAGSWRKGNRAWRKRGARRGERVCNKFTDGGKTAKALGSRRPRCASGGGGGFTKSHQPNNLCVKRE